MAEKREFPMVVATAATLPNHTGTWRAFRPVYVQQTPPCRESCPAGEDVARWMDLLRSERYREAWEVLVEDNPFPAVMGRICVHPCESNCNRGHHDAPMGINSLEQFLGDRALAEGWPLPGPAVEQQRRVAVVGGGFSGLTCAYQLRRMGYQVTLFEAGNEPGGHLIRTLPEYQLSPAVATAEIRRILDLGVEVRTGVRVSDEGEVTWKGLRGEYAAVYMAIGAPVVAPPPELSGQDLPGCVDGVRLLQAIKAIRSIGDGASCPDLLDVGDGGAPVVMPTSGTRVLVIGAGLTGIETARTLRRLGAMVTIVTAESDEALTVPDRAAEAVAEGATLICGNGVRALIGDERITGARLLDREIPAELVVLATGRMPDLESFPEDCYANDWHVAADRMTGETGVEGLFAGGDVTGTRYAVEAVGAGKRGAAAIDSYLQGRKPAEGLSSAQLGHSPNISMRFYRRADSYPAEVDVRLGRVITYEEINTWYFARAERTDRLLRPTAERLGDFGEVRLGLTEEQALSETQRCFNCGTCISCDNCLVFCPDMAISKTADGTAFNVDLDYCKGCGACVQECPREALVLEEELK